MTGIITNDIEFLIDCVKKRPALYSKSLKEYSDINLKKRLWEEVCLEAVSGWAELDTGSKKLFSAEVQRKWMNLRTCFARELKAQRTKSGLAATKRHKYLYFEKLLFLESCVSHRPAESRIESRDQEVEDSPKRKKEFMQPHVNFLKSCMSPRPTESNIESNDHKEKVSTELKKELMRLAKQPNPNFQETLLHILKEDLDEDKNFALSLVPTLKSLTEDEKFQAKIDILQVLRRIKSNRRNTQKL